MAIACPALPRPLQTAAPQASCDKWAVLRDLGCARAGFGLSDRDLLILQVLLSFHPEAELRDGQSLIVFPSNRTLSDRAHGMAESTLRRRLAHLVESGMLQRHDSPNGKRYAARGAAGAIDRAFGFDLRPLLLRAVEIADAAEAERARLAEVKRLREAVVLALRDIETVTVWGRAHQLGDWDAADDLLLLSRRALRRKLDLPALEALLTEVDSCREQLLTRFEATQTSGCDSQNERHIQDSNKLKLESLKPDQPEPPCLDEAPVAASRPAEKQEARPGSAERPTLAQVLQACPDMLDYLPDGVRHPHELVAAATVIAGYLGIDAATWTAAQRQMGPEDAAYTLSALLQSAPRIAKPGAYLRSLSRRHAEGRFTPGPMIRALERASPRAAA